jgi:hypothetical protein
MDKFKKKSFQIAIRYRQNPIESNSVVLVCGLLFRINYFIYSYWFHFHNTFFNYICSITVIFLNDELTSPVPQVEESFPKDQ